MSEKNEWRDQIMEIITGVWDREIQIDHATDEIMELLSPTSSAPGDAQDERQAFEEWAKRKKMPLARIGQQYDDFWVDHAWNGWQARAALAAPAAGDAQALKDLQRLMEYADISDGCQYGTLDTGLVRDLTAKARAALAAQVPNQDKGDA